MDNDNLFDEMRHLKSLWGLDGFVEWGVSADGSHFVEVREGHRHTPPYILDFKEKAYAILNKHYPKPLEPRLPPGTGTPEQIETQWHYIKDGPLPDTGERREFGTGAVRDASKGKGHFHSIPPIALRKLAKRFEDGAAKYEKNNWMKGISLSAYVDSIERHFLAIQEGATDEDHAGALIWNACCMAWTDEEIKAGRLPKELDDLPYRGSQK